MRGTKVTSRLPMARRRDACASRTSTPSPGKIPARTPRSCGACHARKCASCPSTINDLIQIETAQVLLMKKKLHYLLLVLLLIALLPFVRAAETRMVQRLAESREPGAKFERRVFPPGGGEKEIVTFLGVETAPVSPTLSAQLNLPKE